MASLPTRMPVQIDPLTMPGTFINAFRIMDGPEDKCCLEFLVYSQTDNLAHVVGKVLVAKGLLPDIRDKILEFL